MVTTAGLTSVGSAVAAGLVAGMLVACLHRYDGRKVPGVDARAWKWLAWTALVTGIGFYLGEIG